MTKTAVSVEKLSSAFCDVYDIVNSMRRRTGQDCLQEVKSFLETLYPAAIDDDEKFTEVEIDAAKLKVALDQLRSFASKLDAKTRNQSKDDECSEITIGDCVTDALDFLRSL